MSLAKRHTMPAIHNVRAERDINAFRSGALPSVERIREMRRIQRPARTDIEIVRAKHVVHRRRTMPQTMQPVPRLLGKPASPVSPRCAGKPVRATG